MRTFALSFAATAVLFAPAIVQAQGVSRTVCQNVGGVRVCDSVYYPPPPPPPPPAPEPPPKHTTGSEETVHYDGGAEARKAQIRATAQRNPPSSGLCPPPYRMTAQDGCQR